MSEALSTELKLDGADRNPIHSDDELVRRWLYARNSNKAKRGGQYLWALVMEEFCVGSTSAYDICRRHGYDPEVMVKRG